MDTQYYVKPEDHQRIMFQWGIQRPFLNDVRNTLVRDRDSSITRKLGGGPLLQTKDAGRRGDCRTGFANSHGCGGFLKHQKPGGCSYCNDLQGPKGSHAGLTYGK